MEIKANVLTNETNPEIQENSPKTFVIPESIELDYEEPEFIFRHLPNEYAAQDFDNDLKSYYYQGRIKYGQLDEDAIQELQREYNLDKTQLQETFNDLFNAGYGESLVKDLEDKPVTTEEVNTYKEGGELIPKAMAGIKALVKKKSLPKEQFLFPEIAEENQKIRKAGYKQRAAKARATKRAKFEALPEHIQNRILNDRALTKKQRQLKKDIEISRRAIKSGKFKPEINWDPEKWLEMRKEMDKYDPSLTNGQSYGKPYSATNPKGYTPEDVEAFKEHIPELQAIEYRAKKDGTWMQNADSSTYSGDPRIWVMQKLEGITHDSPVTLYTGMDASKAKEFMKYNGRVFATDFPNTYFGEYNIPFRTSKSGFETFDAEGRTYDQVIFNNNVPVNADELLERTEGKGIIVNNINENWNDAMSTANDAIKDASFITDYAFNSGHPRWFLYGNTGNFNIGFNKQGGRLIPKAMSGKVLEEAENILQFNKLDLAQNISKKQLLLAKRLLGFVSGKGTQSTGRKLNSVLSDGKLTQKQLQAIGNLNYRNKAIRKALNSKKALSDQELAALANTRQGKALINKFKVGNLFKKDLENGINNKSFSGSTRNNILNEQDSLQLAAEVIPISKAIKYTGEKALPSKKLVECLQKSAKNTENSRVQLLSDSLEEAYNKGIYLPQTYLDYVAGILKTSKVKKGSDLSEYKLKALTKDSLNSSSVNDDLDQAIASLQEIADGNFTVNQKILEKVYTTKGGAIVKNPLEAANTKLERKYFTDKEWSRAMEEQMGDVSKIDDLTTEEINAFFDSGVIPDRFKTPYHTNIPEALQKYYDHSNSNIYDMRVKKKYVEQVVKELKKNNPDLEGEIKITPITDDDPVTVLVKGTNGEIQKKTLEGYKHLVGYNFTIGGKEILPELRTTLEQHHELPLGIIQGTNTLANPTINNAKELLNTRLNQIAVNPEYLLLTKPFHTGTKGIHYNDKWTPQDISRQKELAFTHAFKDMDEVEKFYTKISRKRYANLLSKGDKDKALQLEQEMINNPSKLQEYQQKYLTIKRKEFVKKLDKGTRAKIEDWRKFREDNNLTTEEFVEMAKEYPKEFPGFSKILKGFDSDEELLAANILKHGGQIIYFKN